MSKALPFKTKFKKKVQKRIYRGNKVFADDAMLIFQYARAQGTVPNISNAKNRKFYLIINFEINYLFYVKLL